MTESANISDYYLRYAESEPEWYVWDITGMVVGMVIGYTDYAWTVLWGDEEISIESNEADGVLVLWNRVLKEVGNGSN